MPPQHPRRRDVEPPQHLAHAAEAALAQRLAREVAVDRPEPDRVDGGDGRGVAGAERGGPQRMSRRPSPASTTQARADAPAPPVSAPFSERWTSVCIHA